MLDRITGVSWKPHSDVSMSTWSLLEPSSAQAVLPGVVRPTHTPFADIGAPDATLLALQLMCHSRVFAADVVDEKPVM